MSSKLARRLHRRLIRRIIPIALVLSCGGSGAEKDPSHTTGKSDTLTKPHVPTTTTRTDGPKDTFAYKKQLGVARRAPRPNGLTAWPTNTGPHLDSLEPVGALPGSALNPQKMLRARRRDRPLWINVYGPNYISILDIAKGDKGQIFLCSGTEGLFILDGREPAKMTRTHHLYPESLAKEAKSSLTGGQRCQALAYEGGTVYASHRGDSFAPKAYLAAYDLSAAVPKLTGLAVSEEDAFGALAVRDGRVYVGRFDQGLAVMKPEGTSFTTLSTVDVGGAVWDLTIAGDHLFVAAGVKGLVVLSLSAADKPTVVGGLTTGSYVRNLAVDPKNKRAYLTSGTDGLQVVDISDPARPRLLGSVDTPGLARAVAFHGTQVFVADWHELRVYDTSDPKKITQVGSKKITNGRSHSLTVSVMVRRDEVFVGDWFGLHVFRFHPDRKEAPDIYFDPAAVDFGNPGDGEQVERSLRIENHGNAPLAISGVTTLDGAFSVRPPVKRTVAPGGGTVYQLQLNDPKRRPVATRLFIETDDPDEGTSQLALQSNLQPNQPGAPAPEVVAQLLNGKEWKLSQQRGHPVLLAYFATF